jgi:LPXTG-site transpeptidase (sortase) family protein
MIDLGLPGASGDVYVDGILIESGSSGVDVVGPLDLEPGSHRIEIFPADADPAEESAEREDSPLVAEDVNVIDGRTSVAVHYDRQGRPTISVFSENLDPTEGGTGRLVVRNVAGFGPVELVVDGDVLGSALAPAAETSIDLPVGDHTLELRNVDNTFATVSEIPIEDGELLIVSVVGADGPLPELIGRVVTGLEVDPGVDFTGNSGLLGSALARPPATALTALDSPVGSATSRPLMAGVDPSSPVHVSVANRSVGATVVAVGVDEDQHLSIPEEYRVAWYRHSATAGNPGASVLAAHVDYNGSPGAFFSLETVEVGDVVEVTAADGTIARYRVTGVELILKPDVPLDELFRKSGEHVLHLVTCGGAFDRATRSYASNLVVSATLVDLVGPE